MVSLGNWNHLVLISDTLCYLLLFTLPANGCFIVCQLHTGDLLSQPCFFSMHKMCNTLVHYEQGLRVVPVSRCRPVAMYVLLNAYLAWLWLSRYHLLHDAIRMCHCTIM